MTVREQTVELVSTKQIEMFIPVMKDIWFAIRPEFRRRGFGRAAIIAVFDFDIHSHRLDSGTIRFVVFHKVYCAIPTQLKIVIVQETIGASMNRLEPEQTASLVWK